MDESLAKKEEEKARESRLHQAIENDDVDKVHELIAEEPELLDRVSKHPFPNTPLHLAAAAGKTQVAMEMAILEPSFARKLNPKGYSPMHLALQHKHYQTVRALVTLDPKLIRVRGQGGITPLHFVVGEQGDNELELLAEFLCACKSSIEDLTSRCETAIHVAIKKHNLQAFKVLFGWLNRVYLTEILNWKDEDGNTVLHIAVLERQPEIIKLLIGHVKLNAKNFQGQTALEIFRVNPSGDQNLTKRLDRRECLERRFSSNLPLSQFLSKEQNTFEKLTFQFGYRDESARGIILLVATLIATATYQAMLTPPGGYWQDSDSNPPANSSGIAVEKPHQAGNIILSGSELYQFTALNSTVFLLSIITIWITAVPLWPRTFPVYVLTACAGLSYIFTSKIPFPMSDKTERNRILCSLTILLTLGMGTPLCLYVRHIRLVGGTDATRRRIGNLLELKDRK